MICEDLSLFSCLEKVVCRCDRCGGEFKRTKKNIKVARKRRGQDVDFCHPCSCALSIGKKPQCSCKYWTGEKRKNHGEAMRSSPVYRAAIDRRDMSGDKNGMYGRRHSAETRAKMSASRTGKIGKNATGWKGGKLSLVRRVKGYLHKEKGWYKRVYERDGFKCVECGGKSRIDAHHIRPISVIVSDLLKECFFESDDDRLVWLLQQPEVLDGDLVNGITLCRRCHKKVHEKWGSHKAVSLTV